VVWSGGGGPAPCGATRRRSRGFGPTSERCLASSGPEPASAGGIIVRGGAGQTVWTDSNLNGFKQFQIFLNFD
jgi:hypothetical protein